MSHLLYPQAIQESHPFSVFNAFAPHSGQILKASFSILAFFFVLVEVDWDETTFVSVLGIKLSGLSSISTS